MTHDLRSAAELAREALRKCADAIDNTPHRLLPPDISEGLSDALDAIAPALAALEADGWRGIETAPKDKTHFLVWDAHYGTRIGKVHIRADHDDWLSYVDAHGNSSKGGIRATHWHPLPLPPPPQGEK